MEREREAIESNRAIHELLAALSATSTFVRWSEPLREVFAAIPVDESVWTDEGDWPALGAPLPPVEAITGGGECQGAEAEDASLKATVLSAEVDLETAWAEARKALDKYQQQRGKSLDRLREAFEAAAGLADRIAFPPLRREVSSALAATAAPGRVKMSKAERRRRKKAGVFTSEHGLDECDEETFAPPPPVSCSWTDDELAALLAPLASELDELKMARFAFCNELMAYLRIATTRSRALHVALRKMRVRAISPHDQRNGPSFVTEAIGSQLTAVLRSGLAGAISEEGGGVLAAVHGATTLSALHDSWQQLHRAYAIEELADTAAAKERIANLAAEVSSPAAAEQEDDLLRRLAHMRVDRDFATRQRQRAASSDATADSSPAQEREDAAVAAVDAAWTALSEFRLQTRIKRHKLDEAISSHFPEEKLRLRALSSEATGPLLRSLCLPHRELDEYAQPPPTAAAAALAADNEARAVLTHGTRRRSDGRSVLLKGYTTDGDLEQERRLCRELRTLSSAALLHCPSLLHPSAVATERGGRRLWLEYVDADGARTIIEHVEALRGDGGDACSGGSGGSDSGGTGMRVYEATRELIRQAMTALAYMHCRGLAHKNLTPDSLLIGREGRLLLANFELSGTVEAPSGGASASSAHDAAAAFNHPLMSPPTPAPLARMRQRRSSFSQRRSSVYASPEHERGDPLGAPSDIFQLGTVLHYLSCRRHYKPMCNLHPTGRSVDLLLGAMLRTDPSSRSGAEHLLTRPYFSESTVDLLASESEERAGYGGEHVLAVIATHRSSSSEDRYGLFRLGSFRIASTNVFNGGLDAFERLLADSGQLRQRIRVCFTDSSGSDAGGLTSEFYTKLWDAIANPANGLFEGGQDGLLPVATRQPHLLHRLQIVGGVLAKTAYDGRRAAAGLSLALFKFLRETPIEPTMNDVIAFDKQLATSLIAIGAMNDDEIAALCLEFERPDGTVVEVEHRTRDEYLRTRPRHICVDSRLDAMVHLRDGFALACVALSREPNSLYEAFSQQRPAAVRSALCDVAIVTAEAVRAIVRVDNALGDSSRTWLAAVIREMSSEKLRDLLYFATAARCLPSATATGRTITFVHASGATDDHMPVAHTCSNRVDLPRYTGCDQLRHKLLQAMSIACVQGGFQFA